MNTRHVVQVSSYYPPHLGGQENAVRDLARQLAAAGHHVQVLASSIGGTPGAGLEDGVMVQRLRGRAFGHAPVMPAMPSGLIRAANKDSVVHLHIGQAFTPEIVWLVSKLRRYKYVAELHIDFEPSGPIGVLLPLYKQLILKRVLHSAASVAVLNERMERVVREKYGYKGPLYVMRNGIDEDYYNVGRPALRPEPPRCLRLLFVGRLSNQKNLPALIKALTLTKRKTTLDILGEGEERHLLEDLIAVNKLANVTLRGRQNREDTIGYYKSCDALIMPSLYESQPLVLLEALAAGIPIIGTNVIGVAEHIKDVGIVVEPTAEGLAEGIERYYTDYPRLGKMATKGRAMAEAFRWQNVLKDYERLYETVASN